MLYYYIVVIVGFTLGTFGSGVIGSIPGFSPFRLRFGICITMMAVGFSLSVIPMSAAIGFRPFCSTCRGEMAKG